MQWRPLRRLSDSMPGEADASHAQRHREEVLPREARDLISKIRSCTVRSDLKNKQKTVENCLAIALACYRIGFGPPARNRKKIGQI